MSVSPSALGDVLEIFEENFRSRGELGASISVWWDGDELLSVGEGWCEREKQRSWTPATLIPVYSATKVPAAATVLLALEAKGLKVATPVTEVWPKFPVREATFAHLLSHQCGLVALDLEADMFEHGAVVAALEVQNPAWILGEGHGYHPRTFGALTDEIVRRLTGKPLGRVWRELIADPLGLDFWIGLPQTEWQRVARLYPGKAAAKNGGDQFYDSLMTSGTLTQRAFSSPRGLRAIHEMNQAEAWSAGLPALGGIGTASALAKFYQAAIGSLESPISPAIRDALAGAQISGDDRVLLTPTTFTCGAQQDPVDENGKKLRRIYGPSKLAFGHPGAGGSHAFGDPQSGISFAYTMNQMELSVLPTSKCLAMVEALFADV